MMLAEKTQNTKLHLQYDYNCTNHVGQDWKKLWSNDNSLIFGGNGMRDNFFFFFTITVLMFLLLCKMESTN